MTNAREGSRRLGNIIANTAKRKSDLFDEGIVIEISRKSKKVKVKLIPSNSIATCRILFENVGKEVFSGSMPIIGSRCLVAKIGDKADDIYDDCVIIGFLNDEKDNKEVTQSYDSSKDPNYHVIKPKNGGKIELFKDSSGKQKLYITGLEDLDIICKNGHINIVSGDVSLGGAELDDSKQLVLKPHLGKYDDFITAVTSWITLATPTLIAAGALSGAVFSPTATPEYLVNSNLAKENNTNKTTKTKAT